MHPKSIMLLALALGCGLVASIGISQVMDRPGGEEVETAPIYVASANINVGDTITPEVVRIEPWPKNKIPAGAIRELKKLEGQRAKQTLFADNPILEPMLGGGGIPAKTIPIGMRASSIKLGNDALAAELLTPGDRVDVQLTMMPNKDYRITQPRTKVILTNVRVWAVDQTIDRNVEGGEQRVARVVSLLLSMEQADKLDLAQKIGKVRLVLRNPDDITEQSGKSIGISDLLSDDYSETTKPKTTRRSSMFDKFAQLLKSKKQGQAAKPTWKWRVIQGNDVSEVDFDANGRPLINDTGTNDPGPSGALTSGLPDEDNNGGENTDANEQEGKKSIEDFLSDSDA